MEGLSFADRYFSCRRPGGSALLRIIESFLLRHRADDSRARWIRKASTASWQHAHNGQAEPRELIMSKRNPLLRVNLVELMAFALVLAIVVGVTSYRTGSVQTLRQLQPYLSGADDELRPLAKRFGERRDSRQAEEWMIRDYFADARDGVFADVGANHYRRDSNT